MSTIKHINIFEAVTAGGTTDKLHTALYLTQQLREDVYVDGLNVFQALSFTPSLLWAIKGYYPYRITVRGGYVLKMKLNKYADGAGGLSGTPATSYDGGVSYQLPNNTEIFYKAKRLLDEDSVEIPGSRQNIAPWNHTDFADQPSADYRNQLITALPPLTLEKGELLECWLNIPRVGTAGTDYPSWTGSSTTNSFKMSTDYSYFQLILEYDKV